MTPHASTTLRALASVFLAAACADAPAPAAATTQPPILVLAVDGLEWDVMLPMLARGELPALAALMERGTYGLLETLQPTLSPVIWTTIATGKAPAEHGIANFARRTSEGEPQLYTNRDRRVKAVWDIASEHGKRSAVLGWWMTWPVDPIDGVMVAQTNTVEQLDLHSRGHGRGVLKGRLVADLPHQVHPPELTAAVMKKLAEADRQLPARTRATFGTFPHPLSLLGERLWSNCLWSFRADSVYAAVAEELLAGEADFDLTLVYFGGPDVVAHRFWRYHSPETYDAPPSASEIENFGQILELEYAWIDAAIGRLVAAVDEDARILVVSDHGMHAVNQDARFDPDDPPADVISAHHRDAPPGVIIAAGPDLVGAGAQGATLPMHELTRAHLRTIASIYDLAPTLLTLLDIPLGRDLRGSIPSSLVERSFLRRHPPRSVATHEDAAWSERHTQPAPPMPGAAERLDELRALGYVPARDE